MIAAPMIAPRYGTNPASERNRGERRGERHPGAVSTSHTTSASSTASRAVRRMYQRNLVHARGRSS